MKRQPLSFPIVLAVSLVGCGGGVASVGSEVAVRDSAGVMIVDNGELDGVAELLTDPSPILEIGVVDGPEEFQLFQVSDAKRLPDGGFAVANGGSREVKIYTADGSHRVTAGGSGEGPSEFRYPVAIRVLSADTILVQDLYDRVYFTPQGEYLSRTTIGFDAIAELGRRAGGSSEGGQWMADGAFFAPVYRRDESPPVAGPLYRPPMTFVRASADFLQVDALGEFGGILQQFVDTGRERPSSTVPPYSTNTSWGLGAADGAIVAADNAVPQIHVFNADGAHTIARWSAASEPVTAADVERWKDEQRAASWAQRRLPELEREWAVMDVPATKPYYGRGATGSDGRTWLGPADSQGEDWIVVEPDGRIAGIAHLPGAFWPMDSGRGWVLGLYRDEHEVEFLRLYGLVEE